MNENSELLKELEKQLVIEVRKINNDTTLSEREKRKQIMDIWVFTMQTKDTLNNLKLTEWN